LETLAAECERHRSLERREKDRIDVKQPTALLATNLVGGPGVAVEIKPKWGFLPSPTYLSDSTRPIKTQTCRFCMHTHLRAQQGEKVSSGYCPLDLFSGDEARMKTALNSLWDAWSDSDGTINNFKVFVGGKKILPEDRTSIIGSLNGAPGTVSAPVTSNAYPHPELVHDIEALLHSRGVVLNGLSPQALVQMLRRYNATDGRIEDQAQVLDQRHAVEDALTAKAAKEALTTALLPVLMNTPILRILSRLQRTLDALDIEGLAALSDLASVGADPTIAEWAEFVSAYLAAPAPPPPAETAHLRYHVLAYLLSATFKDCSVILRVPDGTATVIDLDPKSVDRLCNWERMDKEIVAAYAAVPDRKVCLDAVVSG